MKIVTKWSVMDFKFIKVGEYFYPQEFDHYPQLYFKINDKESLVISDSHVPHFESSWDSRRCLVEKGVKLRYSFSKHNTVPLRRYSRIKSGMLFVVKHRGQLTLCVKRGLGREYISLETGEIFLTNFFSRAILPENVLIEVNK